MTLSAATLLGVSPVFAASQNATTVEAAKKSAKKTVKKSTKKTAKKTTKKRTSKKRVVRKHVAKKTTKKHATKKRVAKKRVVRKSTRRATRKSVKRDVIVLKSNSYLYFANGKRNMHYRVDGKTWLKIGKGAKLYAFGTKVIKGNLYYYIGNRSYINALNVGTINGKKVNIVKSVAKKTTKKAATKKTVKKSTKKTSSSKELTAKTITLTHNAYVYNSKGERVKALGTLKADSTVIYYQVKTIDGVDYLDLGHDHFVKLANTKTQATTDTTKTTDTTTDTTKTTVDADQTVVTLKSGAFVYDAQGQILTSKNLSSTSNLKVNKLIWIWVSADNKAEEFYQLADDATAYVKVSDVTSITGKQLTAVNTETTALVATATSQNKAE